MMSRAGSRISPPGWGAPRSRAWPWKQGRRGLFPDLIGGALIIAVWLLLWSFIVLAVARPATFAPGHPARTDQRERSLS
jgi:hypothetical protein